jgi:hypothetical protein
MKRTIALVAAILLVATATWAQQAGEQPEMPSPEQMEAVMKLLQPGEHHEHLAQAVGKWTTVAKMWQMPGAPPTESEGTSEIVAVMDGRYLQMTFDGTFMGQPFKGMGIDGYDNIRKKHVGSWIDTMGSGIMNHEGTCSDDHKVVTTHAEVDDPMSGQRVKMRQVTTTIDKDHFKYEAFVNNPTGEGEMQVMEITYTRM